MSLLRCLPLLLLSFTIHAEQRPHVVTTQAGDEINIVEHAANGAVLFLWLPSEAGPHVSETRTADRLASHGIEVWRLNLVEDYFLPTVASSLEQIPASTVRDLIQQAITKTGKRVYLVSTGRGAIPMLRGAHLWQQQHPGALGLAGAILMSPKFYVETPDPGEAAALMPVVSATNLPLFILQPEQSPWFWKLNDTTTALEHGGSDVFIRRLPGVRDRFNFRPDASEAEHKLSTALPALLMQAAKLLADYSRTPRTAVAQTTATPRVRTEKKDHRLQTYKGKPQAPELRLPNLNTVIIDLKDVRGRVVLVNFWASWCPPCVHEMPSMQRLQDLMQQQDFAILGVNMAEDKQTIQEFLDTKVKVNFPVVMDSKGLALKRWGVFAFPTSYLIDKQGRIRYALFGSVEWDAPEMVSTITSMINESSADNK